MTPSDQMSTGRPLKLEACSVKKVLVQVSGGRYSLVPLIFKRSWSVSVSITDMPKSEIFTVSSELISMLSCFMSQWIMFATLCTCHRKCTVVESQDAVSEVFSQQVIR